MFNVGAMLPRQIHFKPYQTILLRAGHSVRGTQSRLIYYLIFTVFLPKNPSNGENNF